MLKKSSFFCKKDDRMLLEKVEECTYEAEK